MGEPDPISQVSRRLPALGVQIRGSPTRLRGLQRPEWFQGAPIQFGGELAASPSMSTDYASGFPTNNSSNLPKIVRRFRDELMATNQIGQLVLARKERKNQYPAQSRLTRYSILNVPAWNHLMASTYKMPESWEDIKTAEEVFRDWYVEGIVAFETGEKAQFYDNSSLEERLLNITVRGQAFTFKGWTGELTVGTKLFLILKREDLPQNYYHKMRNGFKTTGKPKPFTLSFWADKEYERPPQAALEYMNEFGFREIGKAIAIGNVLNIRGALFDDNPPNNIHRQFEAMLQRPKISIIVDPAA